MNPEKEATKGEGKGKTADKPLQVVLQVCPVCGSRSGTVEKGKWLCNTPRCTARRIQWWE
jgi:hypothetical protein